MTKLKPCPFCGGKVGIGFEQKTANFKVYHKTDASFCCVVGGINIKCEDDSFSGAIEAWNRRVDDD